MGGGYKYSTIFVMMSHTAQGLATDAGPSTDSVSLLSLDGLDDEGINNNNNNNMYTH